MTAIDSRLLCQCNAQPDSHGCDYQATAEDMLCAVCRAGCVSWCFLAAEDLALHLPVAATIDWDEIDGIPT